MNFTHSNPLQERQEACNTCKQKFSNNLIIPVNLVNGLMNNWRPLCKKCFLSLIVDFSLGKMDVKAVPVPLVSVSDLARLNLCSVAPMPVLDPVLPISDPVLPISDNILPIKLTNSNYKGITNTYAYQLISDDKVYKLVIEVVTPVTREIVNHVIKCLTKPLQNDVPDEEASLVHMITDQLGNSIILAKENSCAYFPCPTQENKISELLPVKVDKASDAPFWRASTVSDRNITFYPVWDTTMKCTLVANTPYKRQNNGIKDVEIVTVINSLGYEQIKAELKKEQKKKNALN
jgi:hypothetical protein